jgi:L-arabinokinase
MLIVYYITAHGFGHASRSLEVIRQFQKERPGVAIVIRSSVPDWFLATVHGRVERQALETDTGMAQIDSLNFDEDETVRKTERFYRDFDRRVADEAAVLERLGASLVVSDIPPLPLAAAKRCGIPGIAIANFTWDWIYEYYPAFDRTAPSVMPTIRNAYASAALALRLPFHGGFAPMNGVIRDIPLIARRSTRGRDEIRGLLDLPTSQPIVLASFGGHTLKLPYADIAAGARFTLVVTDYESANGNASASLRRFKPSELAAKGLTYVDLVAAADVVVSKPGYGIVSECIANGASLLYTFRGRFAENAVFDEALPRVLRSRSIPHDDVMAGRWAGSIEALLSQPEPREQQATNGSEVAAREISAFL